MAITAKVTRHFQITIPAEIRKEFPLQEGDILAFGIERGKLVAIPVRIAKQRNWSGSEAWHDKEKEAEEDIREGRILGPFTSLEEAFKALEEP